MYKGTCSSSPFICLFNEFFYQNAGIVFDSWKRKRLVLKKRKNRNSTLPRMKSVGTAFIPVSIIEEEPGKIYTYTDSQKETEKEKGPKKPIQKEVQEASSSNYYESLLQFKNIFEKFIKLKLRPPLNSLYISYFITIQKSLFSFTVCAFLSPIFLRTNKFRAMKKLTNRIRI